MLVNSSHAMWVAKADRHAKTRQLQVLNVNIITEFAILGHSGPLWGIQAHIEGNTLRTRGKCTQNTRYLMQTTSDHQRYPRRLVGDRREGRGEDAPQAAHGLKLLKSWPHACCECTTSGAVVFVVDPRKSGRRLSWPLRMLPRCWAGICYAQDSSTLKPTST